MDKIAIEIPVAAFNTLSRWASVGRTIDAAVEEIIEHDSESNAAGELLDLKYALDSCNSAAKNLLFKNSRERDATKNT